MVKIKLIVMFVISLVWGIGVCGCDYLLMHGYYISFACMTILPMVLFSRACRNGYLDDVLQWVESFGVEE